MKILYIITQSELGGAQYYILMLAKHFRGAIASGIESHDLEQAAESAGIDFFPLQHLKRDISLLNDSIALYELYTTIKRYNPDIVHTNSSKVGILGSLAAKALGKKVVFTAHGFQYLESHTPFKKLFFQNIERSIRGLRDFVITVSERDRVSAIQDKVITAKASKTIYNGIKPFDLLDQNTARAAFGFAQDFKIVGTIANAYQTKGLDILLEAIASMKQLSASARFCIIGGGPGLTELKTRAKTIGIDSITHFAGPIPEARKYMRAFDIFVLPSRKEGFPFVLLEAMQAGLPIITSDVGGNREAIGDAGIIVPTEDPESLSRAITNLLKSPGQQKDLTARGKARSILFSETKMFEQTNEIYTKALL